MATQERTATHTVALERALQYAPHMFGFYQALRRFECLHPDKPRLGESLGPRADPIRLGQKPSMAFAASTLAYFDPHRGGKPARLGVLFFGLFGPNGPLPLHLTEYAWDRLTNCDDPTLARFVDLFHHRLLSLFYRSWANAQPCVQRDRPEKDRFGTYVASLFGLGMPSLRNRDLMPDSCKLFHAGHLANQTRSAEGLRDILASFLGLPVRIEQFVGQWIELPEEDRCRLGASPATGTLGRTLVIGACVWECHHKFRIVFGPLGYDQYRSLLPGGHRLELVKATVQNYIGNELDWDIRLILEKEKIPMLRLGHDGRLGWTSWAISNPPEDDADSLVLTPPHPASWK